MIKNLTAIVLALLVLTLVASAQTQEPAKPAMKLIQFQMALLKRGPNWNQNLAADSLQQKHLEYAFSLLKSGTAVVAGHIKGEGDLVGVYIFRTQSADEAKSWVMADPFVATGHVVPELHSWWSEDVFKKIETPQKMTTVYLAFLVKGAKWTPEKTPETEEIQKGHMANIHRLADMKKLIVAGPFGDDGTLRGIFVFRVNSLDEARKLTLTDPAIQAGRLALDLHEWIVPDGILP